MRRRLSAIGLSSALVLGALVALAPATAAAAVTTAGQVVTVSAADSTITWATVDVWQRQPDGRYFRVQHYPDARIGAAGIGAAAGLGSAFFLHVQKAYATGGCVALNQARLLWILRWMRTAENPVISLGIGVTPYNVIPNRYH